MWLVGLGLAPRGTLWVEKVCSHPPAIYRPTRRNLALDAVRTYANKLRPDNTEDDGRSLLPLWSVSTTFLPSFLHVPPQACSARTDPSQPS